jgi:FAD-dependent urate hydroxylase
LNVSMDVQKTQDSKPTAYYDAAVVGAGPYGLSTAAHLLEQGLEIACFGKPIQFWSEQMPQGMRLRSYWWATNLSDPHGKYGMDHYFKLRGRKRIDPLPIETFIDYGLWFQQQAVPNLEQTYVSRVERKGDRFLLTLQNGQMVESATVVMAPGLQHYIYRPAEYSSISPGLVSHTADHHSLDQFAGKRVVVIGGGQSALENAALLHEVGSDVQLVARRTIDWIPVSNSAIPAFVRQLRAPKAGMGSGWLNLLLEKYPYTLRRLPRSTRDYILQTRHGPAGSSWLKKRLEGKVTLHEKQRVEKVEETNGGVSLTLSNNKTLHVDHIILGTGYHADVKRLPMLHSTLVADLDMYMGSPILNSRFESNIPGLYFIGFTSVRSFGPFYRFVVGSEAAARRVTSAIAQQVAQVE